MQLNKAELRIQQTQQNTVEYRKRKLKRAKERNNMEQRRIRTEQNDVE
jgi:uncharacterized protein YigA (DUF484 family)